MHGISKKDITNQSNNAVPTLTFTEEHMSNLLTAYQSLRDLEKLLTIISGIDPENGILCNLRHMDNLIQDLSPLFDPSLDYDQQVYTKVLDDDSLSIPLKAHILLGTKEEWDIFNVENASSGNITDSESLPMPETVPTHTANFTVDNMVDLLIAYYGYYNLSEAIELFSGSYPSHKILMGLSYLDELVAQLSPLHHSEYDEDDIENAEYTKVLNSNDIGLAEKAQVLMSETDS